MQKSYVPMENMCCTAAADLLCFWRYTVGNNIGLWWHNFRANGKGGLWQLHSTSVIAHGSQDTREMSDKIFLPPARFFVIQLCELTSYIQHFYIFSHKT